MFYPSLFSRVCSIEVLTSIPVSARARRTQARTTVPTHPHPGSPHSGGFAQKVFIPLGKVGDSISEALGGKREYVGLAHEHAAITF